MNKLNTDSTVWSDEEFTQFISSIDDDVYKTFFTVLFTSGCRIGELIAIGINDIDQNSNTVTFNKTVFYKSENEWTIALPKTPSAIRTIEIPDSAIKMMADLYEKHHGKFIFYGDSPLSPNVIKTKLRKYCNKAGIDKISIYDFRRFHKEKLILQGFPENKICKRMGINL